jgi:hypothetical protein
VFNIQASFGSLRTQSPSKLSVLRQPAHQTALPKCLTPSPCWAVRPLAAIAPASSTQVPHALAWPAARPSAASVRFCAVASHSTSSPRSRLRRHRLAARAVSATVEASLFERPTKNQAGSTVNTSLNFRHGFSAFSGVQNRLCLTGRSRGRQQLSRRVGNAKRGAP